MQTTGEITDISLNFNSDKTKLTLELDSCSLENAEELRKSGKLNIDIKKWFKKRSLNANNYAWELITKIANMMKTDKEEVYLLMLKSYGQSQMISVLSEIDVSKFLKYYEEAGESILNGKKFKHYKVYTGSSEFDTKQMSILIDGIVQEAKNLGIETMSAAELNSLKESWRE